MGKGGDATLSTVAGKTDFYRSDSEEPHVIRRKMILEKHPEIAELFGYDNRPIPYVVALVLSQIVIAYFSKYMSWTVFILSAWIYGGAASHALSLMTHELSHNLVFKERIYNEYFGIFCNLGMGLPSSTTFKKYHMEHHQFQGNDGIDVDIATAEEGKFFNTPFRKFLFLTFQSVFYAVRPGIIRPKSFNAMDRLNYLIVFTFDLLIVLLWGIHAPLYLVLSLFFGMGLHPVAGHFIAEHYVFEPGHETYSYYGSLNWICWNVGYHNEHHDFPRVPGWRLPQVKAIAPEFYESLPQHKSWCYVLYRFVMDPEITPFCRVVRKNKLTGITAAAAAATAAAAAVAEARDKTD